MPIASLSAYTIGCFVKILYFFVLPIRHPGVQSFTFYGETRRVLKKKQPLRLMIPSLFVVRSVRDLVIRGTWITLGVFFLERSKNIKHVNMN